MKISQFRKYVIDSHFGDEDEYDFGFTTNLQEQKFIQKTYSYLYNEYDLTNYSKIARWLRDELGIPFDAKESDSVYKYCAEKILRYIYKRNVIMETE